MSKIELAHRGNRTPCAHDWTIYSIGQVVPCCGIATQRLARVCKHCHRHEEVQ